MTTPRKKITVRITRTPEGITYTPLGEYTLRNAELPEDIAGMEGPVLLHASATAPRRKIASARWYLGQLRRCIWDQRAALMFFEGFLSAARSSTFALQALLGQVPGFGDWYFQKQAEMRDDEALRWLIAARNAAQKEAFQFAEWGLTMESREHRDGSITAEVLEPSLSVAGLEGECTLADLARMIDALGAIVEEAHDRFCPGGTPYTLQLKHVHLREREDGGWEEQRTRGKWEMLHTPASERRR